MGRGASVHGCALLSEGACRHLTRRTVLPPPETSLPGGRRATSPCSPTEGVLPACPWVVGSISSLRPGSVQLVPSVQLLLARCKRNFPSIPQGMASLFQLVLALSGVFLYPWKTSMDAASGVVSPPPSGNVPGSDPRLDMVLTLSRVHFPGDPPELHPSPYVAHPDISPHCSGADVDRSAARVFPGGLILLEISSFAGSFLLPRRELP